MKKTILVVSMLLVFAGCDKLKQSGGGGGGDFKTDEQKYLSLIHI